MIDILDIIELIDEIEFGCEYGALGVVCCKDGSYWYCNRDTILTPDIEFRAANVSMQDALAESILDPEERFLAAEDVIIADKRMEQPIHIQNLDYFGTKDEVINEVMAGAFEPPFGEGFSL